MKRSFSIINTSAQLVNCIEAIKYYGCTDNYLLVGKYGISNHRIKLIKEILKEPFLCSHFKTIYYLPFQVSKKNPLRFLNYLVSDIRFAFIILFSKKFDYCFYGVYSDVIMRPITYLIQYKNPKAQICLIDEGMRVLTDAEDRLKQEPIIARQEKKKKFFPIDFISSITRKWLTPHLCYFSVFPLPHLERDTLVLNQYPYLKQNNPYHYVFKPAAVVLVGQPFIELEFVKAQTYQDAISKIYNLFKGRPLYYVPHPEEKLYPNFIPEDIEIIRTAYPFELLLLGSNLTTLVGFNSTVLYNTSKMNICKEVLCYRMPYDKYISAIDIKVLDNIYKTFSDGGIKFIDENIQKKNI